MSDTRETPNSIEEPRWLLAVVEDRNGLRWFRWAYDVHTFAPWRNIGAVHCDTEEDRRWSDLDVVRVASLGLRFDAPFAATGSRR